MKKGFLIALLGLALVLTAGCGGKESALTPTEANAPTATEAPVAEAPANAAKEWPKQFAEWGIPTLSSGTVTLTEDRSATQEGMTQGVNVVVNLKEVSKEAFDGYCKELENVGFADNGTSLPGVMMVYEKSVEGGVIKLTLTYSDTGTTVIANNSAAAAAKQNDAGGAVNWPESAKEIPVFDKGKFIETVDMGGGFYTLTFKGVSEGDLEAYRSKLLAAGFAKQEDADTEGYLLMEGDVAHTVGFSLSGETLQLVLMSGKM